MVSELTRALEHVSAHHQHETKSKFLAAQHETNCLGNLLVEQENKIVELTQQLGLHRGAVHAINQQSINCEVFKRDPRTQLFTRIRQPAQAIFGVWYLPAPPDHLIASFGSRHSFSSESTQYSF